MFLWWILIYGNRFWKSDIFGTSRRAEFGIFYNIRILLREGLKSCHWLQIFGLIFVLYTSRRLYNENWRPWKNTSSKIFAKHFKLNFARRLNRILKITTRRISKKSIERIRTRPYITMINFLDFFPLWYENYRTNLPQ